MYRIDDIKLTEYIKSDVPYLDLTSEYLEVDKTASLTLFSRESLTLCGSEEAKRIAELLDCKVVLYRPSKSSVEKGESFFQMEGSFSDIHRAWRLIQNLFEYGSGIATYAAGMLGSIKAENPNCELYTTRKTFPFAKEISVKAIRCGGAFPHRLGLSETILIFDNHKQAFSSKEEYYNALRTLQLRSLEKKLTVEADSTEEAKELIDFGVDALQLDKLTPEQLKEIVAYKNQKNPGIKILAAGGIRQENAAVFAATGVDAIVSGAPYQSRAADIGSTMQVLS